MNSLEMLEENLDGWSVAPEPEDEARRIRRSMRLNVKAWPKKTTRAFPPGILRGTALVAGGFCLGWRAFRFWRG